MTHETFFGVLSLDGEGARQYIQLLIEFFLSVDPHKDNINLHHAYFERLLRMLIGCRTFDKAVLGAAFEQEQAKTSFLEKLFKHAHKLSICCSLEILLTLDLVESSVIFSLLFKQKILQVALQSLAEYLREAADPEKAENCLQMIKVLLERGINFLASKRNLHETQ
uniref:Predicted protein n=1 Tax=Hordeum vulgare subsp. vulgare TaxID=112509 RepID=F2E393_HORVV|nr:predicted protein [Hordeum vulgare subsp. vulgare]